MPLVLWLGLLTWKYGQVCTSASRSISVFHPMTVLTLAWLLWMLSWVLIRCLGFGCFFRLLAIPSGSPDPFHSYRMSLLAAKSSRSLLGVLFSDFMHLFGCFFAAHLFVEMTPSLKDFPFIFFLNTCLH